MCHVIYRLPLLVLHDDPIILQRIGVMLEKWQSKKHQKDKR